MTSSDVVKIFLKDSSFIISSKWDKIFLKVDI